MFTLALLAALTVTSNLDRSLERLAFCTQRGPSVRRTVSYRPGAEPCRGADNEKVSWPSFFRTLGRPEDAARLEARQAVRAPLRVLGVLGVATGASAIAFGVTRDNDRYIAAGFAAVLLGLVAAVANVTLEDAALPERQVLTDEVRRFNEGLRKRERKQSRYPAD